MNRGHANVVGQPSRLPPVRWASRLSNKPTEKNRQPGRPPDEGRRDAGPTTSERAAE